MIYLTKEELEQLSDSSLDDYAKRMSAQQLYILDVMDLWVENYNITSDEYDRRRGKTKSIVFANTSETKH